jgi:hypothetical protein
MARRPRKTAEQRREEFRSLDRKIHDEFYAELAIAKTFSDVAKLLGKMPGPDRPGRRCYANLDYFIRGFVFEPSPGTSRWDIEGYIELIQRLADSGDMKPDQRDGIIEQLRAAIDRIPPAYDS